MQVWVAKALIYLLAWVVALALAIAFTGLHPVHLLWTGALFLFVKSAAVLGLGNFRELWRHTSLADLVALVGGALGSSLVLLGLVALAPGLGTPPALVAVDFAVGLALLAPLRVLPRLYHELLRPRLKTPARTVVLAGRADLVDLELRRIHRQPGCRERVAGLLLDGPPLAGARLHRLRVYGRDELARLLASGQVSEVSLVPPASPTFAGTVQQLCRRHGVACRSSASLLALGELLHDAQQLLSRRSSVALDATVMDAVSGRVVLVTGAGGSIGSELARQLVELRPSRLILVNRGENALFHAERELQAITDSRCHLVSQVLDVRDQAAVQRLFARERPDVVFHAAAHKHVPLMERHPSEAVLNNVGGTRAVAEAAQGYGTQRFVFISTDKAVNPSSVMGATKRLGELYIRGVSQRTDARFVSVRFGNVLGSNGSVLPLFIEQVQRGGPVTVTHPQMTRYFMSIPEACQLVLRAASRGRGGELFVLDMGEPMRIVELAERVIERAGLRAGEDVPIVFSGPRPGEKLAEQLMSANEIRSASGRDGVWTVSVDDLPFEQLLADLDELMEVARAGDDHGVRRLLAELVPEFRAAQRDGEQPAEPNVDFSLELADA
jgi:FlaA1/EpsC-like NDP-sugar epimerase